MFPHFSKKSRRDNADGTFVNLFGEGDLDHTSSVVACAKLEMPCQIYTLKMTIIAALMWVVGFLGGAAILALSFSSMPLVNWIVVALGFISAALFCLEFGAHGVGFTLRVVVRRLLLVSHRRLTERQQAPVGQDLLPGVLPRNRHLEKAFAGQG